MGEIVRLEELIRNGKEIIKNDKNSMERIYGL